MIYNVSMATKWKVTSVHISTPTNKGKGSGDIVWHDTEEGELEKISRGATLVARESLKGINVQKAQDCRKRMLQELLSAK